MVDTAKMFRKTCTGATNVKLVTLNTLAFNNKINVDECGLVFQLERGKSYAYKRDVLSKIKASGLRTSNCEFDFQTLIAALETQHLQGISADNITAPAVHFGTGDIHVLSPAAYALHGLLAPMPYPMSAKPTETNFIQSSVGQLIEHVRVKGAITSPHVSQTSSVAFSAKPGSLFNYTKMCVLAEGIVDVTLPLLRTFTFHRDDMHSPCYRSVYLVVVPADVVWSALQVTQTKQISELIGGRQYSYGGIHRNIVDIGMTACFVIVHQTSKPDAVLNNLTTMCKNNAVTGPGLRSIACMCVSTLRPTSTVTATETSYVCSDAYIHDDNRWHSRDILYSGDENMHTDGTITFVDDPNLPTKLKELGAYMPADVFVSTVGIIASIPSQFQGEGAVSPPTSFAPSSGSKHKVGDASLTSNPVNSKKSKDITKSAQTSLKSRP